MDFLKLDQKPPDMLPSELKGCFGTIIFQVLYFSIKLPVSLVSLRASFISEQIVQNKKLNLYYEAMLIDSQKWCLQICQTRKRSEKMAMVDVFKDGSLGITVPIVQ